MEARAAFVGALRGVLRGLAREAAWGAVLGLLLLLGCLPFVAHAEPLSEPSGAGWYQFCAVFPEDEAPCPYPSEEAGSEPEFVACWQIYDTENPGATLEDTCGASGDWYSLGAFGPGGFDASGFWCGDEGCGPAFITYWVRDAAAGGGGDPDPEPGEVPTPDQVALATVAAASAAESAAADASALLAGFQVMLFASLTAIGFFGYSVGARDA